MNQTEQILPLSIFADLDRSGPIPIYFQLAQKIEKSILDGALPAGSRLENEVSIGERLGLSRPTVRRAIQDLVDKGLLVRRRGIGTQVVHGQVTRGVELSSLYEDLSGSGQKPSTNLLDYQHVKADAKLAEHLGVKPGALCLYIKRLRKADNVPVSIMENWLPEEFCDITADEFELYGLYQMLRARGVTIRVAKQKIGARKSNAAEAQLLDIEKGAALLSMTRTAYDSSGRAIEFGIHCYRPDLYSFEVTLVEK